MRPYALIHEDLDALEVELLCGDIDLKDYYVVAPLTKEEWEKLTESKSATFNGEPSIMKVTAGG